jgi:hypothetical protein
MSSSSGVGNGVRGRGIVRHRGGRGGRGLGRGGFGRTCCLNIRDCTFTARLPCKWVIWDV